MLLPFLEIDFLSFVIIFEAVVGRNMCYLLCDHCDSDYEVFARESATSIPFLSPVPNRDTAVHTRAWRHAASLYAADDWDTTVCSSNGNGMELCFKRCLRLHHNLAPYLQHRASMGDAAVPVHSSLSRQRGASVYSQQSFTAHWCLCNTVEVFSCKSFINILNFKWKMGGEFCKIVLSRL